MGAEIMNFEKYINIKYKQGGRDKEGCDCYGLVKLIYEKERGIILPDFNDIVFDGKLWYDKFNEIDRRIGKGLVEVQPPFSLYDGIIFYSEKGRVIADHIGMWIGNNRFIHVGEKHSSRLDRFEGSWKSRFYKALRYVDRWD